MATSDAALDAQVCAWVTEAVTTATTLSRRDCRRVLRNELHLLRREAALRLHDVDKSKRDEGDGSGSSSSIAARERVLREALACVRVHGDAAAMREAAVQLTLCTDLDTFYRLLSPYCVLQLCCCCGDGGGRSSHSCECIGAPTSSTTTRNGDGGAATAASSRDDVIDELCKQHATLQALCAAPAATAAVAAVRSDDASPSRPSTRATTNASVARATVMRHTDAAQRPRWVAAVSDVEHWLCDGSCHCNGEDKHDDDNDINSHNKDNGNDGDAAHNGDGDDDDTATVARRGVADTPPLRSVVTVVTYFSDVERTTPCFSLHTTFDFDLADTTTVLAVRRQLRVHEPYDETDVLPHIHFGHAGKRQA